MARCAARWFEERIVQLGTGGVMPTWTIVPVCRMHFLPLYHRKSKAMIESDQHDRGGRRNRDLGLQSQWISVPC